MSLRSMLNRLVGRAAPAPGAEETGATPAPAVASGEATVSQAPIAGYVLGDEIGRGAMAVVYKATQQKTRRQVAIKRLLLQREFAAEDLAEVKSRFMREARAAGHLQHPDILQVLDAGEAGADTWIAMEYVLGRDLSHYTRADTLLPATEVLRLCIRLARALDHAHRHGVVHRDIKPANVMLDRVSDSVKVMDFGIARVADGSRTRTGLVLGTPSFMSPEQLAGLKVDGRSDLYSLGVMLYQLLTGQLPFQSSNMAKLMYQISNEPAPDVRHLRADLPESLAMVIALALEKRPELRYASGEQMAVDLEAVLAEGRLPAAKSVTPDVDVSAVPDAFAQTLRMDLKDPRQNP